jgi:hypothetical protein
MKKKSGPYSVENEPDVTAEWSALLFHIVKVLGSNLSLEPAIMTGFSLVSSVPQHKCQDSTLN